MSLHGTSQRSILFDTETTGLDPLFGDRIIELAAIELHSDLPTGRRFHAVIDPERDVPEEATRVHGFTRADLQGKPRFAEICDDFLAFIGDAPLVAHNAPFDFAFVSAELARLDLAPLDASRMIDTLALAKQRFPGLPNSLDALCRRLDIDLAERTAHNALLDCRLLAEVYVELTGGRQRGLALVFETGAGPGRGWQVAAGRVPRLSEPTPAELQAHAAFVARLTEALWIAP